MTGSHGTRRKRTGHAWLLREEDCSLFAFKILVVFIKLIFLKAGTCFSPLPFPSLLATSVCNRLLLHTSSFLFDQLDHLARFLYSLRPAFVTHDSLFSHSPYLPPTPGALFFYFLSWARKREHAASPCQHARARAWRVLMWGPAPRGLSYLLP